MTPEWFTEYMHQVSGNILNREGGIRFSYITLKTALNAAVMGNEEDVPLPVVELFRKIVQYVNKIKGPIDIDDKCEAVLLLSLINCNMEYLLASGYLIEKDDSIKVATLGRQQNDTNNIEAYN